MKRIFFTAAMVLCSASFAVADGRFDAMDTDKNGTVSWEEFQTAIPQMRKPAFEAIDADKDGAMTSAEWLGFIDRHGEGGKGMGEGMTGGMGGMMPPMGMGKGDDCPDGKCPHKSMMPLIEAPKK